MVITKGFSRLGRDYMVYHYMERYFPEYQVRYISLLDSIDAGVDSTANNIMPFCAIMHDMYAKDISKKIKSVKRVKRAKQHKGQPIGRTPDTSTRCTPRKSKIVVDEEMAPTVRHVFTIVLSSMRKIIQYLSDAKMPTPATYANPSVANPDPYTGLWSSEHISDMLQNEASIGNMVQSHSVKISYKSKKSLKQERKN